MYIIIRNINWVFPTEIRQASQMAQQVKNMPVLQQMQARFQGQEDPLEEETATHSRILA